MNKVFITGATGLVGSCIARRLLQKGYSVRALKRPNSKLDLLGEDATKIEWINGDVGDIFSLQEGMEGVSHVVHSAAVISFKTEDAELMMKTNVDGTANVMNCALEANVKKVLHISSVAAFCRPKGTNIIDENHDIKDSKDNFAYYRSKFLGEREALRAHAEGLNVVIINPSTILGGGYWHLDPNKIFPQVESEYPFYTNGTNGFVDVRDVCEIGIRLLESDISGEKFIVSAENKSLRDVMWKIADELGVKRAKWPVNKWLATLAWRVDWLKARLTSSSHDITKDLIEVALTDFKYSNEKVKHELNYSFIPLDKTIKDVAELYTKTKQAGVCLPLLK